MAANRTSTETNPDGVAAVLIACDGTATRQTLERKDDSLLSALQTAVEGNFDVIGAHTDGDQVDAWVNDEGIYTHGPNPVACVLIAAAHRAPGRPIYGPVLFTGTADAAGDTTGLTDEQADHLVNYAATLTRQPDDLAAITDWCQRMTAPLRS